jgi:hypothetical protein
MFVVVVEVLLVTVPHLIGLRIPAAVERSRRVCGACWVSTTSARPYLIG